MKKENKHKAVYILPRWIGNNRGDIISRYGFIKLLLQKDTEARLVVITDNPLYGFEGNERIDCIRYGPLKDIIPNRKQWKYIRRGNSVLWAVGQDLVDESSLFIIPHMMLKFLFYRFMGLKIHIVAQGAGPIKTSFAKQCVKIIMRLAESASFRDQDSFDLIARIVGTRSVEKFHLVSDAALLIPQRINNPKVKSDIIVGVNVRRWYHLTGIVPYEYRMKFGLKKDIPGDEMMQGFVRSISVILDAIIKTYGVRILFMPMYPSVGEKWEDDYYLSEAIINSMTRGDRAKILADNLFPEEVITEFSRLSFMIGVRLHSTIIATSLGIPSIHLAYSPKGFSYYKSIGEERYCLPLDSLVINREWKSLLDKFEAMWNEKNHYEERLRSSIPQLSRLAEKMITYFGNHK